ncbi:MAG: type II CRISPR-associated endonuclease Cas1 [Elusimicrobiota bacterium]
MSYHLVHILQPTSQLSIDRGCLVCGVPDQPEKRIPLSDILAVVVAARGVSFSSDCLSSLIKNRAIVLHCDGSFKPIGKTVGLGAVVHQEIFKRQISSQEKSSGALWDALLRAKIENQAALLDGLRVAHKLRDYLSKAHIDEGNAARHYWARYFSVFGEERPIIREHQNAQNPINRLLNYGYAVTSAILHRSLLIHGLNTSLGVHHRYRFKTDPLLYDLFEPLRPICDFMLSRFRLRNPSAPIEEWIKNAAKDLLDFRIKINGNKSLKLLYVVDHYASSVADFFCGEKIEKIFIPRLSNLYFESRD